MTKRSYNFNNSAYKKPKLDDDIEALWGEDLDESALDDCIKLATQVLEEEKVEDNSLNLSKIPSYNIFIQPERILSSTQCHSTVHKPSTSKELPLSNKENASTDLQKEIEKLQLKYQEKEGEVSILRSQLKETKVNFNTEQQKLQNEWRNKFIISEKHVQSVKSELEFKTLEIANLKQKFIEVTKKGRNTSLNASVSDISNSKKKKVKLEPKRSVVSLSNEFCRLHTIVDSVYPLRHMDKKVLITLPKKEKFVMETKQLQSFRKAIPYLQNQQVSSRHFITKNSVNFEEILTTLLKLINSSEKELNSNDSNCLVDKVILASCHLLEDLYDLLKEIKLNIRTEDILELDSVYIRNNFVDILNSDPIDELGFNAGIILTFVAELLLYCDYMKKFISSNSLINFKMVNNNRSGNVTGYQFLNQILNILTLSGEIRKADLMTVFLNSSIKLCLNICKSGIYSQVSDIFCDFVKELIFLRPHVSVIIQITYLFKEASVYPSFIEFVFNKAKNCSSTKRGVVYFNNEACRFYIFALMFDRCLFGVQNLPFDVYRNLLCFIYNTYKTSYWIHHQNAKDCECLPHLYKLEIEIVHKTLQNYLEVKKTRRKSKWDDLFKTNIVIQILSLIMFHSYELTEKYITVFSQYKETEILLAEDGNLNDLKKLNISEEIHEINSKHFEKINF